MKKKDIKSISLIGIKSRTSNSYGRNMPYMRYRVLLNGTTPIEDVFDEKELKENLGYWSTRSNTLSMTCWGTSQLFEAQISLGRWIGFGQKNRWSEFSRECRDFIKEI